MSRTFVISDEEKLNRLREEGDFSNLLPEILGALAQTAQKVSDPEGLLQSIVEDRKQGIWDKEKFVKFAQQATGGGQLGGGAVGALTKNRALAQLVGSGQRLKVPKESIEVMGMLLNDVPQQYLTPVRELKFDLNQGQFAGTYNILSKKLGLNPELGSRSLRDHITTLWHELTHARQVDPFPEEGLLAGGLVKAHERLGERVKAFVDPKKYEAVWQSLYEKHPLETHAYDLQSVLESWIAKERRFGPKAIAEFVSTRHKDYLARAVDRTGERIVKDEYLGFMNAGQDPRLLDTLREALYKESNLIPSF